MEEELQPLLLCMENMKGEEVTLAISPSDDFNAFLAKAKATLGFDVDLNSVTKNHPVQLTDNIYQFLIQNEAKTDKDPPPRQTLEEILQQSSTDLVYILDDGTQINASQIHFDNEDPFTDLTKEYLPFVKYNHTEEIDDFNVDEELTKKVKLQASPVSHSSNFINSIPFKLVTNHTSGFEAQFIKHLQGKTYTTLNTVVTKKSPKTLIKDNYKKYVNEAKKTEFKLSRDDVVNMLKDSAVTQNIPKEKRRHKRPIIKKSHKYIDLPYFPIGNLDSQDCLICSKFVNNSMDRLYIFDTEDQKLHRSSPQKRRVTQLKILCEGCLNKNFVQCPIETQNRVLNSDEYLIIRNNQQYIYRLINKVCMDKPVLVAVTEKDVQEAETKNEQIIDIEVIEQGQDIDDVIDNLEQADENVKLFLGKYQKCVDKDLICRFCQQIFTEIQQVIDHGPEHKHELDDGEVYPCPLCDYGYADFKWLKGHLKTVHTKTGNNTTERNEPKNIEKEKNKDFDDKHDNIDKTPDDPDTPNKKSPVANKSQNMNNGDEHETSENQENVENKDSAELKFVEIDLNDVIGKTTTETDSHVISTEVKQECLDSDDAIWIVHTDDSDVENKDTRHKKVDPFCHKCLNCDQLFVNAESLTMHRCIKRARKRKTVSDDEDIICIPSEEDFLKRAQGRIKKQKDDENEDMNKNKKDNYNLAVQNSIVTCHNCNENFSSKVRLKFHMQFHDKTDLKTPDGEYKCTTCPSKFQLERALFDHVHFRHLARRRWQCPLPACKKTFRLRATLTKHSRIHTDTRRYVCQTCGKRFLDKQTLDEHSVTHLQTKPFQCHICLKQLTRRSRLRMHLRAHEELTPQALLVCVLCHRAFRDKDEAEVHAQTSSSCLYEVANEMKQEAEQVTLSPSSGLIKRDSRSPHAMKLSERTIPRQASPARAAPLLRDLRDTARALTRVALADRAYRCEFCEDVFYSGDGLNKHRVVHKGVKNPFTCHICKVSFATYSRCTTHKTTHGFYKRPVEAPSTGIKSENGEQILGYGDFPVAKHFMCEDCGRSYLHWTYLQVHRRMKHGNENYVYKCNSCHLTFPNSWSVSYHRKKVHGKSSQDDVNGVSKISQTDYRIPCRDCDELLPNKNALYMHRSKEHSDLSLLEDKTEIFYCVACGNQFHSRTAMATHNMQCNNITQNIRRPNSNMTSRLRNARKTTRTRTNRKAETILVMEFPGLDPAPDDIMASLNQNNVNLDKIIDINKISFPKGVKSVIPSSHRALMFISNRQKNEETMTRTSTKTSVLQPCSDKPNADPGLAQDTIVSEITPKDGQTDQPLIIIKAEAPGIQGPIPEGSETPKDIPDINVSLLLSEGVNSDQNVPLQFDQTLL